MGAKEREKGREKEINCARGGVEGKRVRMDGMGENAGQRTCIICEKKRNSFTPTVFGVAVRVRRVGNDVGFDRQQNCWTDDIGAKRHDCLSSTA